MKLQSKSTFIHHYEEFKQAHSIYHRFKRRIMRHLAVRGVTTTRHYANQGVMTMRHHADRGVMIMRD